jgi:hypothetical protein
MRQMEFRRVRRRWRGVTSQLLYMTCRAFMRRNADLPGFRYTSSCPMYALSCPMHAFLTRSPISDRHPEARARASLEGCTAPKLEAAYGAVALRGPRFARAPQGDGDSRPCSVAVWHSSEPCSFHRHIMFRFFHLLITSRFRAAFGARIISLLFADPERGGRRSAARRTLGLRSRWRGAMPR